MFPPLPEEKAAKVLDILVQKLNSGETELIQVSRVSEERKNQGVMLGVLVCEDENGNEVKLVTNSGISKKLKTENGKLEISFNEKTDFLRHFLKTTKKSTS